MIRPNKEWLESDLARRFDSYARIYTTSDRHSDTTPTTERQWDLIRKLVAELQKMGVADIYENPLGYVIARIPANTKKEVTSIGFMAHVDTSQDASGENVVPTFHKNYDGAPLSLKGLTLDESNAPGLKNYIGETIITSDGTTLLGADDKAGVAEIMAAARFIMENPDFVHGPLELIFTPDEETGKGMDKFPYEEVRSEIVFTMDSGDEGSMEVECFNAYKADVHFQGRVIHSGYARGQMQNAVTMAAKFIAMLPQNESPEATDGSYGFYFPLELKAGIDCADLEILLRDFDMDKLMQRVNNLEHFAKAVEAAHPGSKVTVKPEKQYLNMKDAIKKIPGAMDIMKKAIRDAGAEPFIESIRGGTDGARLAEQGIPSPNIFAGGHNFHSCSEWVPLSSMVKASLVILNITEAWTEK